MTSIQYNIWHVEYDRVDILNLDNYHAPYIKQQYLPPYPIPLDLAQDRMTLKQVRLWDLGCHNGLVTGVGSCFTPFETWPSHHKPRAKCHLAINSEVFMNNKQVCIIGEMLIIICDPLELWKYATDRTIKVLFHSIRASGPPRTGRKTGLARA